MWDNNTYIPRYVDMYKNVNVYILSKIFRARRDLKIMA